MQVHAWDQEHLKHYPVDNTHTHTYMYTGCIRPGVPWLMHTLTIAVCAKEIVSRSGCRMVNNTFNFGFGRLKTQ